MDCENNKQSNYVETKQRFFLGDSDDSDCEDEPPKRRFSFSESECSDDSIVGGVPTDLNFDDDSGLGMSIGESEHESIASNDSSQIVPLRPVNIGKGASRHEHKQQRTHRGKKHRFNDFYEMRDDHLGSGAYASVSTCISRSTGKEFAVKLVNKHEPGHTRSRILREVDVFKMCLGHQNIVQLIEWFEDEDHFYMIFEKMLGGPLLGQIQNKVCFNEQEAAQVAKDIANALKFLHSKGVAHRDLKPENVLCTSLDSVSPVKLCDLDLCSKPYVPSRRRSSRLHNVQSEPDLSSPVGSAEFLAPEVVEKFCGDAFLKYNRQCDLWSLGVIIYIMLCGYVPFFGSCEKADSCGWNEGKPCDSCQEDLFEKIRQGSFEFPSEEWDNISEDAKDLIRHLLVKDVRQRYTASDVLEHPWINSAPPTALNTANLLRKCSSRDLQQVTDHFNAINYFTSRLSSRVEETIPSLGSTPENEALLDTIESQKATEKDQSMDPSFYQNDMNQMPAYYPQMINMNGEWIYAPQMAQNSQYMQQPPYFYQQPYYMDCPVSCENNYYQQQNFMPQQVYQGMRHFETPNNQHSSGYHSMNGGNQVGHVNYVNHVNSNPNMMQGAFIPPQNDPQIDSKNFQSQHHRGSLSTAISQLQLETCQNAMVRQGSSGKEIHQTRETQVNV